MSSGWTEAWAEARIRESAVTEDECRALWGLASQAVGGVAGDGWIVDLGTWRGRTAIVLRRAAAPDVPVATVDAFAPYDDGGQWTTPPSSDEIRALFYGAGLDIEVVAARSERAAEIWSPDRKVGMLFVDAAHDEESVRTDWDAWRIHLKPGAVVAWHDYDAEAGWADRRFAGVRRVVDDLVDSGALEYVERVGTLIVTRAPGGAKVEPKKPKASIPVDERAADERGRVTGSKPAPPTPPATKPPARRKKKPTSE